MLKTTIAASAILLLARTGWAVESDPCAAASSNPEVQLTVAVKGGQAFFRQGEMIPLVISYTAAEPHRFWRDEPDATHFCVDPAVPDPLEAHFKRRNFMGGGLFSWHELDVKPSLAEATLNERLKFAPGRYRVYAATSSVWHAAGAGEQNAANEMGDGRIHETVRSNTIEFEVQPSSAEWQQEQLQSAVATLVGPSSTEDAKRAARVLRFLDTKASAKELAKMLAVPRPNNWLSQEFSDGLYASSYRELAIDSMRKEMAIPEAAIGNEFLETLVELEEDADSPGEPPAFDSAHPELVRDFWDRQQKVREERMNAVIEDTLAALPRKQGVARAVTINALLLECGDDATLAQQLRPALIASWKDLPRETQQQLIGFRWELVAGPAMLPILRGIVSGPAPPDRTEPADMRNAALKHIYEMDPVEGHALILGDLMNPKADLSMSMIRLLSAEEIASGVPAAVERIGRGTARGLDYDLVDRYGDAAVLGALKAAYGAHPELPACGNQPKMLRYFLRVAPEYGAEQVRASMAIRKDNGCYKYLLQALGDQIPAAQQSAIEALDDPDPDVVQDAVIALTRWGTADAEAPLWARLERLHGEWKGHENEIRITPDWTNAAMRAYSLEQALTSGLAGGSGWVCPPDKLARLAELVVTRQDRSQVEGWTAEWKDGPLRLEPQWFPEDSLTFSVLASVELTEDQLIAKLGQFPRGTRFVWPMWKPGQIAPPVTMEKQQAVFERMKSVAEEHGLSMAQLIQP
ncbi:MAG: hypothetical protein ABR987_14915 [Terracidiphilus sp.]|jgi:hypothetical protein